MKYKTTKKAVNAGYSYRINIGNGNLQRLLGLKPAIAYIARREGWACDIYDFDNVALIDGYSPFGNVKADFEVMKKYDEKADADATYTGRDIWIIDAATSEKVAVRRWRNVELDEDAEENPEECIAVGRCGYYGEWIDCEEHKEEEEGKEKA